MQFRTVSDLFACVRRNAHKIPRDIDLVVGVPRSGILAACAISLAINRPYVDIDSFLDHRFEVTHSRRKGIDAPPSASAALSVLVVDDSIFEGTAMRSVRDRLAAHNLPHRFTYSAVYGIRDTHPETDIVLEVCPPPRVFEWNIMNHAALGYCCVDLDGILCVDPTSEENDDGPNYIEFLRNARPINVPRYVIHSIVTSRLEKYRRETEAWLRDTAIEYRNLFMLDLPSAAERRRLRMHGKFKAQVYASQRDCLLFIESERHQAKEVQRLTGKPVLYYGGMELFSKTNAAMLGLELRRIGGRYLPNRLKPFIKSAFKIS